MPLPRRARPAGQRDQPAADPARGQLRLLHRYRAVAERPASSCWSRLASLYARGLRSLWRRRGPAARPAAPARRVRGGLRASCSSRSCRRSTRRGRRNLPAHMVQHVLLLAVVPPLLAVGDAVHRRCCARCRRCRRAVQPTWRGRCDRRRDRDWLGVDGRSPFACSVVDARALAPPGAVRRRRAHTRRCTSPSTSASSRTADAVLVVALGAAAARAAALGVLARVRRDAARHRARAADDARRARRGTRPTARAPRALRDQQLAGVVMWGVRRAGARRRGGGARSRRWLARDGPSRRRPAAAAPGSPSAS